MYVFHATGLWYSVFVYNGVNVKYSIDVQLRPKENRISTSILELAFGHYKNLALYSNIHLKTLLSGHTNNSYNLKTGRQNDTNFGIFDIFLLVVSP
jgi:hypothetical protein